MNLSTLSRRQEYGGSIARAVRELFLNNPAPREVVKDSPSPPVGLPPISLPNAGGGGGGGNVDVKPPILDLFNLMKNKKQHLLV